MLIAKSDKVCDVCDVLRRLKVLKSVILQFFVTKCFCVAAWLSLLRSPLYQQEEDVRARQDVCFLRQVQHLHGPQARGDLQDPEAQEGGHREVPFVPRFQVAEEHRSSHEGEARSAGLEALPASWTHLSRK